MTIKKNIFNILTFFLVSHLIVWTAIPFFSNVNLPLDTIEALAWSSNLDWGYNKHPPISAVAVEIFYQIFGSNDWAFYLLSQIFVIIAFIYVWKISNLFLKNKIYSLMSVLILESIFFFNYTTPEFNVYVCQLPFRVMAVYYCWKGISQKRVIDLILFGIFSALGFLTHYSFIFLLISLVAYYLFLILKKKIKVRRIFFIPLIIFFILLLPHIFWLIQNNFNTIFYAMDRTGLEESNLLNHLKNPVIFIFKQMGILSLIILIFFLILENNRKKIKIKFTDKKFLFLSSVNILPILIILTISILTGAKIRTMWMSTFYLLLGVYLFYILENKVDYLKIKRFFISIIFLFVLSPSIYLYISLSNDFKRTDYPGKEIAMLVQNKWDENFRNDIKYVIGDEWSAGNLSYHLYSRPVWMYDLKEQASKIQGGEGVIYTGNPKILKKICPGVFGSIKPVGYCMIGSK